MTKAVSKGNKFELEAKKTLEHLEYKVFRQHRKPIFIEGRMIMIGADVFGFDLIAKADNAKPRWVQVSTLENLAKKKRDIQIHPINLDYERYEIWIRNKGVKSFKIYVLGESRDTKELIWIEAGEQKIYEN